MFPGEINFAQGTKNILEEQCEKLNRRKKKLSFVNRVFNFFDTPLNEYYLTQVIKAIKEFGLENEEDKLVQKSSVIQNVTKLSDLDFKEVLEFGIEKKCVKVEEKKNKMFIVLLNDKISRDGEKKTNGEMEMLMKLTDFLQESKDETKDGFLYITHERCKEFLRVNEEQMKDVIKLGQKRDLIREDNVNGAQVICYIVIRRLDIQYL